MQWVLAREVLTLEEARTWLLAERAPWLGGCEVVAQSTAFSDKLN